MEIKELRIGNFIDRNGLMEVKGINLTTVRVYDHYNKCSISHGFPVYSFKGIELTPEWLERLMWVNKDIIWQDKSITKGAWSKNWYFIQFIDYEERKEIMFSSISADKGSQYVTSIKYVHQLQNLFYSLTGEELAIDKTSLKN